MKVYSKLRILLRAALTIFAAFLLIVSIQGQVFVNYQVVAPYWIGTVLFLLSKRPADYVALAIFVFEFSAIGQARRELSGPLSLERPEEWVLVILTGLGALFIVSTIVRQPK